MAVCGFGYCERTRQMPHSRVARGPFKGVSRDQQVSAVVWAMALQGSHTLRADDPNISAPPACRQCSARAQWGRVCHFSG